eukprot:6192946-Pleurochrysis_carterae.AAC.2
MLTHQRDRVFRIPPESEGFFSRQNNPAHAPLIAYTLCSRRLRVCLRARAGDLHGIAGVTDGSVRATIISDKARPDISRAFRASMRAALREHREHSLVHGGRGTASA